MKWLLWFIGAIAFVAVIWGDAIPRLEAMEDFVSVCKTFKAKFPKSNLSTKVRIRLLFCLFCVPTKTARECATSLHFLLGSANPWEECVLPVLSNYVEKRVPLSYGQRCAVAGFMNVFLALTKLEDGGCEITSPNKATEIH